MRLKVKSSEDFCAGLIFVGIGIVAVYASWRYPMGSALRMGPGYFPTYLGFMLAGLGTVIALLSFRIEIENPDDMPWAFRPWLVLCGTLVLYGVMMGHDVGFIPSLVVLIVGCSLAHKDVHVIETAVLAVLLPLACIAVFIYGLGLPYPLFWWSN